MELDVTGLAYAPSYLSPIGCEVFARRAWGDAWTWLPFVVCDEVQEACAPSISRASFHYDFGRMWRPDAPGFDTYYPYYLEGAYIAVVVYDWWGWAPLWTGVVDVAAVMPHGNVLISQGQQTWEAFGLEHTLDRHVTWGSMTTAGYIDRGLGFNERKRVGVGLQGNRANVPGEYWFGPDGLIFSHYDIVGYYYQHVLQYMEIPWVVAGPGLVVLQQVAEQVNLEGASVWQALTQLVDRRRGLGLTVTVLEDVVVLWVYTTFAEGVGAGPVLIPPNTEQEVISFSGSRIVEPKLTFNQLSLYQAVVVRGGPIFSCFTVSYLDATLEPGWSPELQAAYDAGSSHVDAGPNEHDAERGTELYRRVYQYHMIPVAWDWFAGDGTGLGTFTNVAPGLDANFVVDPDVLATIFPFGKVLERWLPLELEESDPAEPEYQRLMAICLIDDENSEQGPVYAQVEKLDAFGLRPASVNPAESGLGVVISTAPNHAQALDTFDPDTAADSNSAPEWDFTSLMATVNVATDKHLQVEVQIFGGLPGVAGRFKLIEDPEAVAWYIAPGTVIGVTDGALVQHAGGLVRDDSARLYAQAALAAAWYGQPRSTVRWTLATCDLRYPPGSMIRGVVGPEGYTIVGTVVTERVWRFTPEGATTQVSTGFEELDFGAMGRKQ